MGARGTTANRTLIAFLQAGLLFGNALAAPLEVEIVGVSGEQRSNVEAALRIAALEQASAARVRSLHAQAPDEIRAALEPFGHYRVEVRSQLDLQAEKWLARYEVDPGPAVRLSTIDLRLVGPGAEAPIFAEPVNDFPLVVGDALVHAEYERGKRALEVAALEQGYLDFAFRTHRVAVEPAQDRASIELICETGPQFRYGPLRFAETDLAPEFLVGYVPFVEGEPLRYRELLQLQKRLSRLTYFSRVEVAAVRAEAEGDLVPIDVHLTASRPRRYTLRGGYGTDTGPRGAAGIEFRRIGSRAHRAEVELEASVQETHLRGLYGIPWPYPRTEVLTATLGYSSLHADYGRAEALRMGLGIARSRGRVREDIALLYQREDFAVGIDSGLSTLLLPELRWTRTWADDRLDPRRGARLRLRLRSAWEEVISDVSLVQAEAGAKWIHTFGGRLRLIARGRIGQTVVTDFHRLPPSLRYFAGGTDTVRGYNHNSLGPHDANEKDIGGDTLLALGGELEWLLFERFGWALFWDGGNAYDEWSGSLAQGVGSGPRWRSPIGMVRVDLAWPLGRSGGPVFHLAIGPEL